jgi:lipid-A-disaccharide synthase
VVTYSADAHQAKGYRKLDAPMIGLPNIIAGRRVVPEVLFAQPDPPRAIAAIRTLIDDPQAIEAQRRDYLEIRALMQKGTPEAPLLDPVDRVLAHAGGQRLRISS